MAIVFGSPIENDADAFAGANYEADGVDNNFSGLAASPSSAVPSIELRHVAFFHGEQQDAAGTSHRSVARGRRATRHRQQSRVHDTQLLVGSSSGSSSAASHSSSRSSSSGTETAHAHHQRHWTDATAEEAEGLMMVPSPSTVTPIRLQRTSSELTNGGSVISPHSPSPAASTSRIQATQHHTTTRVVHRMEAAAVASETSGRTPPPAPIVLRRQQSQPMWDDAGESHHQPGSVEELVARTLREEAVMDDSEETTYVGGDRLYGSGRGAAAKPITSLAGSHHLPPCTNDSFESQRQTSIPHSSHVSVQLAPPTQVASASSGWGWGPDATTGSGSFDESVPAARHAASTNTICSSLAVPPLDVHNIDDCELHGVSAASLGSGVAAGPQEADGDDDDDASTAATGSASLRRRAASAASTRRPVSAVSSAAHGQRNFGIAQPRLVVPTGPLVVDDVCQPRFLCLPQEAVFLVFEYLGTWSLHLRASCANLNDFFLLVALDRLRSVLQPSPFSWTMLRSTYAVQRADHLKRLTKILARHRRMVFTMRKAVRRGHQGNNNPSGGDPLTTTPPAVLLAGGVRNPFVAPVTAAAFQQQNFLSYSGGDSVNALPLVLGQGQGARRATPPPLASSHSASSIGAGVDERIAAPPPPHHVASNVGVPSVSVPPSVPVVSQQSHPRSVGSSHSHNHMLVEHTNSGGQTARPQQQAQPLLINEQHLTTARQDPFPSLLLVEATHFLDDGPMHAGRLIRQRSNSDLESLSAAHQQNQQQKQLWAMLAEKEEHRRQIALFRQRQRALRHKRRRELATRQWLQEILLFRRAKTNVCRALFDSLTIEKQSHAPPLILPNGTICFSRWQLVAVFVKTTERDPKTGLPLPNSSKWIKTGYVGSHTDTVTSMRYDAKLNCLFTSSFDGSIKRWNLRGAGSDGCATDAGNGVAQTEGLFSCQASYKVTIGTVAPAFPVFSFDIVHLKDYRLSAVDKAPFLPPPPPQPRSHHHGPAWVSEGAPAAVSSVASSFQSFPTTSMSTADYSHPIVSTTLHAATSRGALSPNAAASNSSVHTSSHRGHDESGVAGVSTTSTEGVLVAHDALLRCAMHQPPRGWSTGAEHADEAIGSSGTGAMGRGASFLFHECNSSAASVAHPLQHRLSPSHQQHHHHRPQQQQQQQHHHPPGSTLGVLNDASSLLCCGSEFGSVALMHIDANHSATLGIATVAETRMRQVKFLNTIVFDDLVPPMTAEHDGSENGAMAGTASSTGANRSSFGRGLASSSAAAAASVGGAAAAAPPSIPQEGKVYLVVSTFNGVFILSHTIYRKVCVVVRDDVPQPPSDGDPQRRPPHHARKGYHYFSTSLSMHRLHFFSMVELPQSIEVPRPWWHRNPAVAASTSSFDRVSRSAVAEAQLRRYASCSSPADASQERAYAAAACEFQRYTSIPDDTTDAHPYFIKPLILMVCRHLPCGIITLNADYRAPNGLDDSMLNVDNAANRPVIERQLPFHLGSVTCAKISPAHAFIAVALESGRIVLMSPRVTALTVRSRPVNTRRPLVQTSPPSTRIGNPEGTEERAADTDSVVANLNAFALPPALNIFRPPEYNNADSDEDRLDIERDEGETGPRAVLQPSSMQEEEEDEEVVEEEVDDAFLANPVRQQEISSSAGSTPPASYFTSTGGGGGGGERASSFGGRSRDPPLVTTEHFTDVCSFFGQRVFDDPLIRAWQKKDDGVTWDMLHMTSQNDRNSVLLHTTVLFFPSIDHDFTHVVNMDLDGWKLSTVDTQATVMVFNIERLCHLFTLTLYPVPHHKLPMSQVLVRAITAESMFRQVNPKYVVWGNSTMLVSPLPITSHTVVLDFSGQFREHEELAQHRRDSAQPMASRAPNNGSGDSPHTSSTMVPFVETADHVDVGAAAASVRDEPDDTKVADSEKWLLRNRRYLAQHVSLRWDDTTRSSILANIVPLQEYPFMFHILYIFAPPVVMLTISVILALVALRLDEVITVPFGVPFALHCLMVPHYFGINAYSYKKLLAHHSGLTFYMRMFADALYLLLFPLLFVLRRDGGVMVGISWVVLSAPVSLAIGLAFVAARLEDRFEMRHRVALDPSGSAQRYRHISILQATQTVLVVAFVTTLSAYFDDPLQEGAINLAVALSDRWRHEAIEGRGGEVSSAGLTSLIFFVFMPVWVCVGLYGVHLHSLVSFPVLPDANSNDDDDGGDDEDEAAQTRRRQRRLERSLRRFRLVATYILSVLGVYLLYAAVVVAPLVGFCLRYDRYLVCAMHPNGIPVLQPNTTNTTAAAGAAAAVPPPLVVVHNGSSNASNISSSDLVGTSFYRMEPVPCGTSPVAMIFVMTPVLIALMSVVVFATSNVVVHVRQLLRGM